MVSLRRVNPWMALIAVLITCAVVFFALRSFDRLQEPNNIQIIGNVSKEDVALIKRFGRRTYAKLCFGQSWIETIKHAPSAFKVYAAHPVTRIEVQDADHVKVFFPQEQMGGLCGIVLKKKKAEWQLAGELYGTPPQN
jgi:hypothetical protein